MDPFRAVLVPRHARARLAPHRHHRVRALRPAALRRPLRAARLLGRHALCSVVGTWDGFWAFAVRARAAAWTRSSALDVSTTPRARPRGRRGGGRATGGADSRTSAAEARASTCARARHLLGAKVRRVVYENPRLGGATPEEARRTFDLLRVGRVGAHPPARPAARARADRRADGRPGGLFVSAEEYDRALDVLEHLPRVLALHRADRGGHAVVFWLPSRRAWRRMLRYAGISTPWSRSRASPCARERGLGPCATSSTTRAGDGTRLDARLGPAAGAVPGLRALGCFQHVLRAPTSRRASARAGRALKARGAEVGRVERDPGYAARAGDAPGAADLDARPDRAARRVRLRPRTSSTSTRGWADARPGARRPRGRLAEGLGSFWALVVQDLATRPRTCAGSRRPVSGAPGGRELRRRSAAPNGGSTRGSARSPARCRSGARDSTAARARARGDRVAVPRRAGGRRARAARGRPGGLPAGPLEEKLADGHAGSVPVLFVGTVPWDDPSLRPQFAGAARGDGCAGARRAHPPTARGAVDVVAHGVDPAVSTGPRRRARPCSSGRGPRKRPCARRWRRWRADPGPLPRAPDRADSSARRSAGHEKP